ncbi:hypothetical protein EV182_008571, partial [Spiromyces aspiralis]
MPPKDREPSPERMTPSSECGWRNMEIDAYMLEPKRAKWPRVTGVDSSTSGAQAGPSRHTRYTRTGHSCAITERSSTTEEWADEHEREAKLVI